MTERKKTVEITAEKYNMLMDRHLTLNVMEIAGVDNWDAPYHDDLPEDDVDYTTGMPDTGDLRFQIESLETERDVLFEKIKGGDTFECGETK